MSLSKDEEQWIDDMFQAVRWGDYQREDGTWGHGVANVAELKATIKAKLVEARLDENEWMSNELTKDVQLPIIPVRVHRLLNNRLAELQGLGEAKDERV